MIRDFDEKSLSSQSIARLAGIAAPGAPNHVTQRGDRLQQSFRASESLDTESEALRHRERIGRRLGDDDFITSLKSVSGKSVRRRKPGPKGSTYAPSK